MTNETINPKFFEHATKREFNCADCNKPVVVTEYTTSYLNVCKRCYNCNPPQVNEGQIINNYLQQLRKLDPKKLEEKYSKIIINHETVNHPFFIALNIAIFLNK